MPRYASDNQFIGFDLSDLTGIMDDMQLTDRDERWRVRNGLVVMQGTITEWLSKRT